MFLRWNLTVFSLMPNSTAISRLRLADGDELQDFQLSIGQALRCSGASARHPEELVDDSSGRSRGDGRLAARHPLQHRAELRRLQVLQQIALGAGLDGAEQIGLVLAHGQHHDGHLRMAVVDRRRGLDTGHVRHSHVHQDDIGRRLVYKIDGLRTVGRLAHDLMAPSQQQRGDTISEQGVIIDEDCSHGVSLPPILNGRTDRTAWCCAAGLPVSSGEAMPGGERFPTGPPTGT